MPLEQEFTENGEYQILPGSYQADGFNSVSLTVNVPTKVNIDSFNQTGSSIVYFLSSFVLAQTTVRQSIGAYRYAIKIGYNDLGLIEITIKYRGSGAANYLEVSPGWYYYYPSESFISSNFIFTFRSGSTPVLILAGDYNANSGVGSIAVDQSVFSFTTPD